MYSRVRLGLQSGFSLVELLVAMLIGLIIVLGAGQIFISGLQTFRQSQQISQRMDGLMFAFDSIALDARTASAMDVTGGTMLSLEYSPARDDNFYCSGSGLTDVVYSFSGSEITLAYQCSDGTSLAAQPLVTGVRSGGGNGFEVFDFFLRVDVQFEPVSGEAADADTSRFSFIVAKRNEIIDI